MPELDNPEAKIRQPGGFLLLDKPIRMSSMQAVARIRRAAGGGKVGHAGTLDPLATGQLVIAIGKATRSLKFLTGLDKRYSTEVDLSAFTTTDDREGDREDITVPAPPARETIERTLATFLGEILQKPPAFSAVKINGKRAYKLARHGDAPPEMPPRHVTLHEATVTALEWPIVTLSLHSGSGFYVRSLARDLGKALGTGGHCASIRRIAVGPFRVEDAVTLENLPNPLRAANLFTVEDALARVASYTGQRTP